MRLLLRCLLAAGLLCPAVPVVAASVSAPVPLDSWVYPALDKLEGLGLIDSSLKGTRPYTRLEASRLTLEARDKAATNQAPPVVMEILQRLERELGTSLDEARGASTGSYFQPLREVRLDYIHQDGPASVYAAQDRFGRKGAIDARQQALNSNNFGLDYADGHNVHAILETEARFGNFFLLNWRPLLAVDEDDTDLATLHATATLGFGPINVMVGRDSLWWGQGRNGSLILTNNAKPLDMVRVTNPSPILLPWVFKHLGPFRFDAFWTELEADRHVPNPYLYGMRVTIKPRPWLELGASRAMMYGGDGRPSVGFSKFVELFFGKGTNTEAGEDNPSNQIAAFDARLRLPLPGAPELYGELGGEDEAGYFLAHKAWLLGIYLPKLESSGRLALRLEYADLTHESRPAPYWYRHGTYRSGYTYEKKILGHHVGGAARDAFGEVEIYLPRGLTLEASLNYQERGTDQTVQEKHLQPAIALAWHAIDNLRLRGRFALDRISNVGFVSGADETHHLAFFTLDYRL
ncbi:capsule assembly Wzi family protein [Geoalkalibacter sp.]|uniref:capsule assembly Wzi family protein n=1 Tax=Geoalkalibacter sp. TaxID=3041440 RepID=UPI00272E5C86|nr:capsule assembly Wzi family protein [Geoalkalibacter sp.]